jgi:hypothetical protein
MQQTNYGYQQRIVSEKKKKQEGAMVINGVNAQRCFFSLSCSPAFVGGTHQHDLTRQQKEVEVGVGLGGTALDTSTGEEGKGRL